MISRLTFFLAFSHLSYPKHTSILEHTIFWENEGFSSGFFKFFLFDLIESFWTFHGGFQFLQVPWYENQCFIMSKLVSYLLRYRLFLFILKTTFSRGWAGSMTKLMAESILHVFLVPHEYCMKSFLGHHKKLDKKNLL